MSVVQYYGRKDEIGPKKIWKWKHNLIFYLDLTKSLAIIASASSMTSLRSATQLNGDVRPGGKIPEAGTPGAVRRSEGHTLPNKILQVDIKQFFINIS